MPTYTFERVTWKAEWRGPCPLCGKRRKSQRTFEQTVNPFHPAVKALGPAATYTEQWDAVRGAVRAVAEAWMPTQEERSHIDCWEANRDD